jgi:arylsulfatase A-like enzyme
MVVYLPGQTQPSLAMPYIVLWMSLVLLGFGPPDSRTIASQPNVILVMTDDQGYGDLACHGNPVLATPHWDQLAREGVELTDFHVDPLCTPTRAALMTGRYALRTGCLRTTGGRSLLPAAEVTMAEVFRHNGYKTGMFGKWHLGDNYPCRPQDRGFEEVVRCGGGGVSQTPDFWGNNYWDDAYEHNGVWERYQGFCTDVFFSQAIRFIRQNAERPFFCLLTPNAPHAPYHASQEMIRPLLEKGVPAGTAHFYAMIQNIDTNVGRLRHTLMELGISDNTLLIFMTDNGTAMGAGPRAKAAGWPGYNAGLKGTKGTLEEGGHLVPCFMYWPKGGLRGGRKVTQLAAHIDILPTLLSWCRLDYRGPALDGLDLSTAIRNDQPVDRMLFLTLDDDRQSRLAMSIRWRLISTRQDRGFRYRLYDMAGDRGQQRDLSVSQPKIVEELHQLTEAWYRSANQREAFYQPITLGNIRENPVHLTAHDWQPLTVSTKEEPSNIPWNQAELLKGGKVNGFWHVYVEKSGQYEITLRQLPAIAKKAIEGTTARLKIGKLDRIQTIPQQWVNVWSKNYQQGTSAVTFAASLIEGRTTLQTWILDERGEERGAFFVEVRYLPP